MTNTESATALPDLRDEVFTATRQGYRLTRTYRVGADVLQVEVYVDSYRAQSYARAQVLGADRLWAVLLDVGTGSWFDYAPSYVSIGLASPIPGVVSDLADELLNRSYTILL